MLFSCLRFFVYFSLSLLVLTSANPVIAADTFLTQEQASLRANRVSHVKYQMTLDLTNPTLFTNQMLVQFKLKKSNLPLRLDLNQAQISTLIVNGKKLYPDYNNSFITLPQSLLKSGNNKIELTFSRLYSNNGEGLHQFIDPIDKKRYLYSHFEPAAAQQVFAAFDQPDIKANYTLKVIAPKTWRVISATKETAVTAHGKYYLWQFPTSPMLSTYNFSVHAGPYQMWQDNTGKYPLRLFARQSIAKHITPDIWFKYTNAGLTFFDDYFGINYLFKKYDQILVPDFLYGAMENAAAITFAESRFLHKKNMTSVQKQALAGVILHEMAHQWFGNLVTMKWWNGLWLNESFASFMGMLAVEKTTEFNYIWRSFSAKGKRDAYQQDRKVTTHPIEVPIAATANAFDNIDDITYNKGTAVLKQLRYLIGETVFKRGVQHYLTEHAWQNATLTDFIESMEKAANRDLSQWSDDWLYSAGVNTIQAKFQCTQGNISQFSLIQTNPNSNLTTLREQKIQLALFNKKSSFMHLQQVVTLTYKGYETAVPSLIGATCPDLVFPNYNDLGYVNVELDQKSFATATTHLSKFTNPLLRSMLWQSLWNSVTSKRITLSQYLNIAFINMQSETDDALVGQIIDSLKQSKFFLESAPKTQHTKLKLRALAEVSLRIVMQNTTKPALQQRWFNAYIELAQDKASLAHLAALLNHNTQIIGIEIDQSTRWKIIYQLNKYAFDNSEKLLQLEKQKDNSDSGQKAAIAASAVRPDLKNKQYWLMKIHSNHMPFSKLRTAIANLYPASQNELQADTAAQRFNMLSKLDQANGAVFMRSYAPNLIPRQCNVASIKKLKQAISNSQNLSAMTQRTLKEVLQQELQCVAVVSANRF